MRSLLDLPTPTGVGPDGAVPSDDPLNEEAVSPQEQADYEQFVIRALQFIHGPETRDAIIDHLNQTDLSVPEAVGRTAAFVAQRIVETAKASGAELSPDAVFHGGTEIVEELFEVGSRAGVLPVEWPETTSDEEEVDLPPETQEMVEQAFAIGVHEYGKDFVQTDEGKALSDEAGNFFAMQVAKEADAGQLAPEFVAATENMSRRNPSVRQGVRRALVPEE